MALSETDRLTKSVSESSESESRREGASVRWSLARTRALEERLGNSGARFLTTRARGEVEDFSGIERVGEVNGLGWRGRCWCRFRRCRLRYLSDCARCRCDRDVLLVTDRRVLHAAQGKRE